MHPSLGCFGGNQALGCSLGKAALPALQWVLPFTLSGKALHDGSCYCWLLNYKAMWGFFHPKAWVFSLLATCMLFPSVWDWAWRGGRKQALCKGTHFQKQFQLVFLIYNQKSSSPAVLQSRQGRASLQRCCSGGARPLAAWQPSHPVRAGPVGAENLGAAGRDAPLLLSKGERGDKPSLSLCSAGQGTHLVILNSHPPLLAPAWE